MGLGALARAAAAFPSRYDGFGFSSTVRVRSKEAYSLVCCSCARVWNGRSLLHAIHLDRQVAPECPHLHHNCADYNERHIVLTASPSGSVLHRAVSTCVMARTECASTLLMVGNPIIGKPPQLARPTLCCCRRSPKTWKRTATGLC
jgi:hypothetical protein